MTQPFPVVNISPSPASAVHLSSLSDTNLPALSGLKTAGNLVRSFLVVSNGSDQCIVAISALWRLIDSNGKERRFRQKCDVFLAATRYNFVLAARSTLYLGPNTCIAEQSPPIDLSPVVSNLERDTVIALANVSQIDITVDAIMFENGDMFAPDDSYTAEITARVSAANEFARYVRAGLARGQARNEILAAFSSVARSRLGHQGAWLRDFPGMSAHQPDRNFDAYIASLDRLTIPVIVIHRN